jgi:hypothetical protein
MIEEICARTPRGQATGDIARTTNKRDEFAPSRYLPKAQDKAS